MVIPGTRREPALLGSSTKYMRQYEASYNDRSVVGVFFKPSVQMIFILTAVHECFYEAFISISTFIKYLLLC